MDVIVANTKHGTLAYGSALGLLRERIADGYFYDGEAAVNAQKALDSNNEAVAWKFLSSRNDYEYEGVEIQTVGP